MNKWIFWRVPDRKRSHYCFVMFLMMLIIPNFIFGMSFTPLGHLINFMIYDFLYYLLYQLEIKLTGRSSDE